MRMTDRLLILLIQNKKGICRFGMTGLTKAYAWSGVIWGSVILFSQYFIGFCRLEDRSIDTSNCTQKKSKSKSLLSSTYLSCLWYCTCAEKRACDFYFFKSPVTCYKYLEWARFYTSGVKFLAYRKPIRNAFFRHNQDYLVLLYLSLSVS